MQSFRQKTQRFSQASSEILVKIGRSRNLNVLVILAAALVFGGWLLNTPGEIWGKTDAVGYAVCHRIADRSFQIAGRPISVCARCTGMYVGAMLALVFQAVIAPRRYGSPPKRVIAVLALLFLAFASDGLNSFSNLIPGLPSLYTTTNTLRIITGTGFGITMAVAVYPAFNQTVWSRGSREPAIASLKQLGLLLFGGILLVLAVLSGSPLVLYPLSFISALGVIVLLTMIYSMLWLGLFRQENRFERIRQLWIPLTAGFALAMFQIAILDLIRFMVTGTWEGFHVFLG